MANSGAFLMLIGMAIFIFAVFLPAFWTDQYRIIFGAMGLGTVLLGAIKG